MNYFSKHKRGILGSTAFHIIILILLIWLGFFTPLPLPGEQGIMVNFGTSSQGFGSEEPSPAKKSTPVVKKEEKKVIPPPVKTSPPPRPKATPPAPAKEEAMTQDYEKTVAIDAAEKKRKEEAEKIKRENEEKERKRLEEAEKERQQQAEIEKEKQAEIAKQQHEAELERQREEALAKQKAEEERKIKEINSLTKNAFSNSGNGGGATGSGSGQSQGVTFPGGNQGVPTGSPNTTSYGEGGSGSGDRGNGISYSLSGRTARALPKPNYPGNDEGIVVVQVTVDKYGNVTKAEAGVRGSTTMNTALVDAARKAALQAKFNTDNNAPAFQTGTITYKFSLEQ